MTRRLLIAFSAVALCIAFGAPSAQAEFGIAEWETVTCSENEDTPAVGDPPVAGVPPLPQAPGQCTGEPASESRWFKQAAGHPDWGITDFTLNTAPNGLPEGFVKDIVVDLPEGLSVNPEAAPKCTLAQLSTVSCPPASIVGTNYLTVVATTTPAVTYARAAVPVWNMEPFNGVPSMVAFLTQTGPTFIVGSLSPKDQHVTFTISDVHAPDPGPPPSPMIVGSRLVFNGKAGNGTYLTLPSNCAGGQTSTLSVDSHQAPGVFDVEQFTTPYGGENCAAVPFEPTVAASTQGGNVDSPEAATVEVGIPFDPAEPIANSYLKTARVTLPEGAGINPSLANGLEPCTDAQFAKGTNDPIACPASSRIGRVEVQTPSLPPNSIGGAVYVGEPKSSNPSSGEQFRIFIHAVSPRYGVNVRLIGKLFPNPVTGQVTALIEENPQATFSSFQIHLDGGPRGALSSPPLCGPNAVDAQLTPWSGNPDANVSNSFTLTSLPGGGACPKTMAERPFAPTFTAASDSSAAGAYSPFRVRMGRRDGEQELKGVDITLPEGLTGKLAGIPYCSEGALTATAANSGTAERSNPTCPAASRIGSASTAAGTGPEPFRLGGAVYLAGPYKGAPLSLAVVTPAVAGPYDLGTVVVRAALFVEPETTQIRAVADPIPNVFGGVKLDLRSVDVDVDRSRFMRNPTGCSAAVVGGSLKGGGANPADPAVFSSFPVSAPYQAGNCRKLGFKPKLFTRLFGPTGRAKNPRIRAIFQAREGDANLARASLVLPHSLFLDQSHIRTVCTRVQLAAGECPKAAIYGHARARTPLLDNPLKGPVYLVSSNNTLPDLVADLRGQVNVRLRGVISSKRGGMKTVFRTVPDVPVRKFILNMRGGNKSLLVNSQNLCESRQFSFMNLKAHNGKKVVKKRLPLRVGGCGKGQRKGSR